MLVHPNYASKRGDPIQFVTGLERPGLTVPTPASPNSPHICTHIGSHSPDCAYRLWTNSEPPRRSKFNADLSRASDEPAAAQGLRARRIPRIQLRLPADRRLEFRSQHLTTMPMPHNSALPPTPTGDAPRVLARLPTVLKITGLGRSTIYRWIADGSFPPPVRLGPRAVAWRWSDLDRWTQSRDSTQH